MERCGRIVRLCENVLLKIYVALIYRYATEQIQDNMRMVCADCTISDVRILVCSPNSYSCADALTHTIVCVLWFCVCISLNEYRARFSSAARLLKFHARCHTFTCVTVSLILFYLHIWMPLVRLLSLVRSLSSSISLRMHKLAIILRFCWTFSGILPKISTQWRYKTLCGYHFTNEVTMKIWDMLSPEIRSTLKRVKANPLNHWIKFWKLYSLLCGYFGFGYVGEFRLFFAFVATK